MRRCKNVAVRNSEEDNVDVGNRVSLDLGKIPESQPEGVEKSSLVTEKGKHVATPLNVQSFNDGTHRDPDATITNVIKIPKFGEEEIGAGSSVNTKEPVKSAREKKSGAE